VDVSVAREKILIDGEFTEGADGERRKVLNPATGEVSAEVPVCSAGTWTGPSGPRERPSKNGSTPRLPSGRGCRTESHKVGKPISSAREELPYIVDNLRFFAGVARDIEGKSAG
jgi:acyl-CoA reductase-like NAD-dependent aldehyde dehydrogenase